MAITDFKKTHIFLEKNRWNLLLGGGLTCLLMFLWQIGPLVQSDTGSYLPPSASSALRSSVYPIILQLNTWIVGQDNFHFLVLCQLLYGFFSAIILGQTLKKFFDLKVWILFPLLIVLLSPYYGPGKFGNSILTEAICYPSFLLAFTYLLKGLVGKNTRSLLYFLSFTVLLILTRRQFLFLYPVFAAVLLYIVFFEKKAFRIGTLIIGFIGAIILTSCLERTYQYIQHGRFSTVPFTGIQLIVAPFYIAQENDIELFEDDLQRNIFKKISEKLKFKHLSFVSLNKLTVFDKTVYDHFYENYNPICWGTISPTLLEIGLHDLYKIDQITTQMALKLIQQNLKPYLILYLSNIIFNLGGYYYCLLLIIISLLAMLQHYRQRDPLSLSCLLVLTLSFANYTLVALVEPVMRRYSTYTDTLQTSILLICIALAFQAEYVRNSR